MNSVKEQLRMGITQAGEASSLFKKTPIDFSSFYEALTEAEKAINTLKGVSELTVSQRSLYTPIVSEKNVIPTTNLMSEENIAKAIKTLKKPSIIEPSTTIQPPTNFSGNTGEESIQNIVKERRPNFLPPPQRLTVSQITGQKGGRRRTAHRNQKRRRASTRKQSRRA